MRLFTRFTVVKKTEKHLQKIEIFGTGDIMTPKETMQAYQYTKKRNSVKIKYKT